MPQSHPAVVSFAGGEWSPVMEGRIDLDGYRQACRTMENMFSLPQGAAVFRPGFRYVGTPKGKARLIPFIHSTAQSYMLELGATYMRFWMDQAQILSGGVPYEIVTPYTEADLPKIQTVQSADVMWLMHQDYPPYKLTRTAHTSWTLTAEDFPDGPYLDIGADRETHLKASATTGTGVTVTAQTLSPYTDTGTYDESVGTPFAVTGLSTTYPVFIFTAARGNLHTVTVNVTTGASGADLGTAYLYASDGAKATGTALATSDTQDFATTGEKVFTFATEPAMTLGAKYAIVLSMASADVAMEMDTVGASASYISGHAPAPTGTVTPLTGDIEWRLKINYQPTADASVFQAGHVGTKWRIRHTGQTKTNTFTATGTGDSAKLFGKFIVDITVDTSWIGRIALEVSYDTGVHWHEAGMFSTSTKQEFSETQTGIYYRLRCTEFSAGSATARLVQSEQWGIFQVTGYTSVSQVTANVLADIGGTDPSPFFREAAWSDVRGYPKTARFDDDRLCFLGTKYQPVNEWRSAVGDYTNFSPDSDALTLAYAKLNNAVQWTMSNRVEVVGTLGEEVLLTTREAKAVTDSNPPFVDLQSAYGSQPDTVAIKAGPAILFIQAGGRFIRQMVYSFTSDGLNSDDIMFLADHMGAGGIAEICYQQTPYSMLWGRTEDGKLIACTYARIGEDTSKGWHRHPTDGTVESISVIPNFGAKDSRHELWAIINRTIGGVATRFMEVLADNYECAQEDAFHVDCGLTYDGVPVTSVTGLSHLEGETVAICADGASQGTQTVTGGAVTLDPAASVVHVGLPYTATLIPQRIEAGAADGTSQGRVKEIASVVLRLKDTVSCKVGGTIDKLMTIDEFIPRTDLSGDWYTGDTKRIPWPSNADTDASFIIYQDEPVPLTVLAIYPNMVTND